MCSDWSWQQSTGQAHTHSSLATEYWSGTHTLHCISLCKCVLTGPGNRVLVRHTHSLSLSLCWSPLVTTAGLMGDGLLMDLGRPGIGLSRDLLHLTLQVCSDWSWQQSTGQAHTLTLSLCWSPLVTTGHHCWSNGGWAPHGPGQTWNWALQGPLTSHSASVF